MTSPTKDRGRSGGDRATPVVLQNWRHRIACMATAAIGRMALCGLIPLPLGQRIARWIGGGGA